MQRSSGVLLVALCIAMSAILARATAVPFATAAAPHQAAQKKGGKPGSTDIALNVTFRDAAADRFTSDIMVPYDDGGEGVSAKLNDSFGNLVFDPAGGTTAVRRVCLDLGDDNFAGPGAAPFTFNGCVDALVSTVGDGSEYGGLATRIQDMSQGEELERALQVRWEDGSDAYLLRFGVDCDFTFTGANPDPALVARDGTESWTVTSGATDVARLCHTRTRGRPAIRTVGDYHVPFQLNLEER